MNRSSIVILVSALCAGCGTVNTVFTDDESVRQRLNKIQTRCTGLPRAYSGVAYDFCVVNAEPQPYAVAAPGVPLRLVDIAVSGIADTLLLPYTLYLQSHEGNLQLR